uniref:hypothetical protein n=1 Tax=Alistipes sp. D31t1_170403_E11 TaxID=2787128 RepID=UPI001897334D|nr:hypothetical protein [Alistipes sp. D31t1_170403_E11]
MAELVRTVNLTATFAQMQKGDTVEIGINDATESNVRAAACRYAKEKKIELKVSVLRGTGKTTVTRKS